MDITFGILFLILNNLQIKFNNRELRWQSYITAKGLSITRQFKLVRKKKFAITAFDLDDKIFIVYIASIASLDSMHPPRRAQIVLLKAHETLTAILSKYVDFADIFFLDLTIELLEYTRISNYAIEFINDKQLLYGPNL